LSEREHGTRARYVFGPDEDGELGPCRCTDCKQANRDYENHRARMKLYGRWQPYVDAQQAREHVRALGDYGIGWKRVAQIAGLASSTVRKLVYGGPGERPPTKRIRAETEAAILAVQPSPEFLGGSAHVDATGTRRRVQALVWCGWSQSKIAARLGMFASNFAMLMTRANVTADTARAVAALYDELWDQAPPEATQHQKIAANRARNYARSRGWVPPVAWDDGALDDPAASPVEGWERTERRGPLRGAELAAEAAELAGLGVGQELAATRLGVRPKTLERAAYRARRTAA
jgi:transcriptional regulator with XRE-family HTH domain